MLPEIAAVIVHYRSYSSIGAVVDAIVCQGILPQNVVVIDNSEQPHKHWELRKSIGHNVEIIFTANNGYGAAVNHALDHFSAREVVPEALLVSTHEARPEAGAVLALWQTLEREPACAVAGPTLISGVTKEFVWSSGGYLNKLTRIPGHYHHRAPLNVLDGREAPETREWLDGAFLLYRWDDIHFYRMPEH